MPCIIICGYAARFVKDVHNSLVFHDMTTPIKAKQIDASASSQWHLIINEPRREKTGLRGFRPGLTQTNLYSHRSRLDACNFGFKKKRNFTIRVAKTKALISFAVTAKLICAFVFA